MKDAASIPGSRSAAVSTGSTLAPVAGFFFSMRMGVVLLFARLLGTEPRVGAAASLVLGLLLFLLICFCSFGPGSNAMRAIMRPASIRWVLAFLAFSLCSLAWSATASLSTSFIYWCGMAADVGSVLLLLRSGSATAVSHAIMKGFIWGTCCLALVAWIMPAQPDLRLGDEEFFNTNQIGNLCAFAIFLAQYLMRRTAGKWGIVTAFLALTLLRSLSKTTIVAFLLAQSFLLIQDRSMSRKTKIFLTVTAIFSIFVFWGLFEAYYEIYTTAGNQAETLTGRTAIWAYCLAEAIQRPWIGHGFDSLWKVIPPFGSDRFEARHAENELLQQFYAYGIAGIAALAGLYGSLYLKLRKLRLGSVRIVLLSLLLFIVVRGFAEAEPFDLLLPLWCIAVIAALVESLENAGQEEACAAVLPRPETLFPKPRNNRTALAKSGEA